MIKGIAFSAYPVSDMAQSRQFYEETLGLPPSQSLGEFWQEYTMGDSTFALVVMSDQAPECYQNTRGTTIAFEVDNLDTILEGLKQKGIPLVYGPASFPTCKMAVMTDPDNNLVTLHQLANKT
jgi:predicted enzyme related to lactoylglutathione lyase